MRVIAPGDKDKASKSPVGRCIRGEKRLYEKGRYNESARTWIRHWAHAW